MPSAQVGFTQLAAGFSAGNYYRCLPNTHNLSAQVHAYTKSEIGIRFALICGKTYGSCKILFGRQPGNHQTGAGNRHMDSRLFLGGANDEQQKQMGLSF
jgi:hypothetical protein